MTALHRRPGIASAATLAGIVLTLGLAQAVAPEWSRAAGLDVWNADTARAELADERVRAETLDSLNDQVQEQIRASEGVVQRLRAGRLTLAAAADELIALNAGRPGWEDGLSFAYRDAPTQRLRVARYALSKLSRVDAASAAQLEAQYQTLRG